MSNPEDDLQEVIWLLRDITHKISVGEQFDRETEFLQAVTPHLLRSMRVALRMVQNDPATATSASYGCAWEMGLAQSLMTIIRREDDELDPPVQEEEPEE